MIDQRPHLLVYWSAPAVGLMAPDITIGVTLTRLPSNSDNIFLHFFHPGIVASNYNNRQNVGFRRASLSYLTEEKLRAFHSSILEAIVNWRCPTTGEKARLASSVPLRSSSPRLDTSLFNLSNNTTLDTFLRSSTCPTSTTPNTLPPTEWRPYKPETKKS